MLRFNQDTKSGKTDFDRLRLSEKEMSTVFNTIFRKYDSNGDGKITKEEFQKICYALGHFLETDELEIAFALVDSDG